MSQPVDDRDVEYDFDNGTYRISYDPASESPSVQVLEAIGAIRNEDPTDLAPLDGYVDPDALDAIFEPTHSSPGSHGSLSFVYEGLQVVVHSDGEIEFREAV